MAAEQAPGSLLQTGRGLAVQQRGTTKTKELLVRLEGRRTALLLLVSVVASGLRHTRCVRDGTHVSTNNSWIQSSHPYIIILELDYRNPYASDLK